MSYNMSILKKILMVSLCAVSVGSVLIVSSCGSGGGGGGGDAQIAPVGLEGLVLESGGVKWSFKGNSELDFTRVSGGLQLIDGFNVLWPDNILDATYTYEVTGTRTGVIRITAASGVDWGSIKSPGEAITVVEVDRTYVGLDTVGAELVPFELEIGVTFNSDQSVSIVSIDADIKFQGVNIFSINPVVPEDAFVDGRLPSATLQKIDGSYPNVAYDPDEDQAPPQRSDKTDGMFDNDTVQLFDAAGDELVKYNFIKAGFTNPGGDLSMPVTETGIAQALWLIPSQADYSLVQPLGTDDIILTLINDTQGRNVVITLHFQGLGDVGIYEASDGNSGRFEFIEN